MIIPDCFYYGFVGGLLSSVTAILIFFATSSKNFYSYLTLKKELDIYTSVLNLEKNVKELQANVHDINDSLYETEMSKLDKS